MLALDHLVVTCARLEEGAEAVAAALGVAPEAGGTHTAMGTHNRLLHLGPRLYLEIIAPDPAAASPRRPRWFALDAIDGPPRLAHWVVRTDRLDTALARAPAGVGTPMALERGALAWRMAVPADGRLPFDGLYPALIEWAGAAHPTDALTDADCQLELVEVDHPRASDLQAALAAPLEDDRVAIRPAPAAALRARIATPHGSRWLS